MSDTAFDIDTIESYELDDHLILLQQNAHRLQILNPIGSVIWRLKAVGLDELQIARDVSDFFKIPVDLALQDIRSINAQWDIEFGAQCFDENSDKQPQSKNAELVLRQPATRLFFALPSINISVGFESHTIAEKVGNILSHLQIPQSRSINIEFDVISDGNTHHIIKDGAILEKTETVNYTALMVVHCIVDSACKYHDWLVVMHAAGVSWQGIGVIMPAIGGSGKTTLTAAFLAEGFDYINDDVIPILKKYHGLVPIPVSLSVKSGSWPLLHGLYPEIESLEVFGTQERCIKYLPPPRTNRNVTSYSARHIILPNYQPGATPRLQKLSVVTGLKAIIEAESLFHLPLNKDDIGDLINWLSTLTCHRLTYDNLEPAVELVTQLCCADKGGGFPEKH